MSVFLSRQFHDTDIRNHTVEFLFLIFSGLQDMPGPLLNANKTKMIKTGCSWDSWTNR